MYFQNNLREQIEQKQLQRPPVVAESAAMEDEIKPANKF